MMLQNSITVFDLYYKRKCMDFSHTSLGHKALILSKSNRTSHRFPVWPFPHACCFQLWLLSSLYGPPAVKSSFNSHLFPSAPPLQLLTYFSYYIVVFHLSSHIRLRSALTTQHTWLERTPGPRLEHLTLGTVQSRLAWRGEELGQSSEVRAWAAPGEARLQRRHTINPHHAIITFRANFKLAVVQLCVELGNGALRARQLLT